ncbi:VMAP-C domain-containing protein, partial [Scytonema sp. PRP1]|uniref:VMAP-C domain-containing protein n=1 Tax=Scytonema sp. PRP1 TaxID=3120513 RepID=UPI00307219DA
PDKNIFLFISKLDNTESEVKEPTSSNIYQVIFSDVSKKEGELLYIFWAGHGYISDVENRRLLYSDDNKNLNLSSLLKSLKTDTFTAFKNQILFIDACATYAKSTSKIQYFGEQLYKEEYDIGKPKSNCEQFTLLAAKEGETAKYNTSETTGLFSQVLMEKLEEKKKLLLPEEMGEVAENVHKVFAENENYKNLQTPIYLWYRDKDGNEKHLGLTKSAQASLFLEERWEELELILSKIDERYILYASCYFVLSEFSKDVNGNYPEINSLKLEDTNREDISKILKNILFKVITNNKIQPIFINIKFVCYLVMLISSEQTKEELQKWNKITINKLNQIGLDVKKIKQEINRKLNNYKKQYQKCYPYLIIVYKPNFSGKFYLSAELIFQRDNDEAKLKFPITDEIEVALTNIQDKIDDFLIFSYKIIKLYGFENNQLIVEIFLPNSQLVTSSEKSYEKIEVKTDIYNVRKWIGCHHKFVLRSFERLQNQDHTSLITIRKKWDQLSYFNLAEQEIDNIFKWISCKEDCTFKSNYDILGINLLSYSGISIIDLLQKQIIREGLPLFLWIRGVCIEQKQLRKEFEKLLNVNNLNDLLIKIKEKRLEAFENKEQTEYSLGYHLGFLCDNPYRLPSGYSTIGNDVIDLGF